MCVAECVVVKKTKSVVDLKVFIVIKLIFTLSEIKSPKLVKVHLTKFFHWIFIVDLHRIKNADTAKGLKIFFLFFFCLLCFYIRFIVLGTFCFGFYFPNTKNINDKLHWSLIINGSWWQCCSWEWRGSNSSKSEQLIIFKRISKEFTFASIKSQQNEANMLKINSINFFYTAFISNCTNNTKLEKAKKERKNSWRTKCNKLKKNMYVCLYFIRLNTFYALKCIWGKMFYRQMESLKNW